MINAETILNIFGISISCIGTVFTLYKIIFTKTSYMGTAQQLDNTQQDFRKEKHIAILGMFLITLGSVLQILTNIIF